MATFIFFLAHKLSYCFRRRLVFFWSVWTKKHCVEKWTVQIIKNNSIQVWNNYLLSLAPSSMSCEWRLVECVSGHQLTWSIYSSSYMICRIFIHFGLLHFDLSHGSHQLQMILIILFWGDLLVNAAATLFPEPIRSTPVLLTPSLPGHWDSFPL